jgi:hypothetical protein
MFETLGELRWISTESRGTVAIKVVLVGCNRNCEAGAGESQHIFLIEQCLFKFLNNNLAPNKKDGHVQVCTVWIP